MGISLHLLMMSKSGYLKKNYFFSATFLILPMLALVFSSCEQGKKNQATFFGGKIKNPKDNYVYFLKDEKVVDSARINDSKRFLFKLDSIETGLYTFKHGPEFQYLYLEPQDSLLLYLNTWDFDESIICSGKGSDKNNFLINVFLKQEEIEKDFRSSFKLNEAAFSEKIDQINREFDEEYQKFLENEDDEPSEFFQKLAKVAMYYPSYTKKEFYYLKHKDETNRYDHPEVGESFYEFRSEVDFSDEQLLSYRTYSYYLESFLYNESLQKELNDSAKSNFSLNYMHLANKHFTNEKIKNRLLASGFWRSISEDHLSYEEHKSIENFFFEHCSDEKFLAEAKQVIEQRDILKPGDSFPSITTYNTDHKEVDINKLVKNKNAVIYFWPKDEGTQEILIETLHKYNEKFPELVFVGIDREKTNEEWVKFVNSRNLPKSTQVKIDKNCQKYPWFAGDMARTIIVGNNGLVKNNYLLFNEGYQLEKNLLSLKSN